MMSEGTTPRSERRIDGAAVTPEDRAFSRSVGARLRAVRKQRGLSLLEVEEKSEGRWSSSALGAYERGFRNLSVPRLRALADFYGVPMAVLLGEPVAGDGAASGSGIVIDLETLNDVAAGEPVVQFVQAIVMARGDFNGRVLSLRRDDLRALCALVGVHSLAEGVEKLRGWGVLVGTTDSVSS